MHAGLLQSAKKSDIIRLKIQHCEMIQKDIREQRAKVCFVWYSSTVFFLHFVLFCFGTFLLDICKRNIKCQQWIYGADFFVEKFCNVLDALILWKQENFQRMSEEHFGSRRSSSVLPLPLHIRLGRHLADIVHSVNLLIYFLSYLTHLKKWVWPTASTLISVFGLLILCYIF